MLTQLFNCLHLFKKDCLLQLVANELNIKPMRLQRGALIDSYPVSHIITQATPVRLVSENETRFNYSHNDKLAWQLMNQQLTYSVHVPTRNWKLKVANN